MTHPFCNLNRIEFVMTMACTGRCKHCSQGSHDGATAHIDGTLGAEVVRALCAQYRIESLMTFGGEPLLYPEDVCRIQRAALDAGIPERHIITNGYFSKNTRRIREVARMLAASGVNKVMLSVDAFHQETIPLEHVLPFAEAVAEAGVLIRTHPAWLVSPEDENPYNRETRAILQIFAARGIKATEGNVIFPAGNALLYLQDYFDSARVYENPYREDPRDMRAICVSADGGVLGGNVHERSIDAIMADYAKRLADPEGIGG